MIIVICSDIKITYSTSHTKELHNYTYLFPIKNISNTICKQINKWMLTLQCITLYFDINSYTGYTTWNYLKWTQRVFIFIFNYFIFVFVSLSDWQWVARSKRVWTLCEWPSLLICAWKVLLETLRKFHLFRYIDIIYVNINFFKCYHSFYTTNHNYFWLYSYCIYM